MKIYVGNLAHQTTEQELRLAFEAFGRVESIAIIKDKFTGDPRGFGFVEMPAEAEAGAAIEGLDGSEVGGRPLKVSKARSQSDKSRGRRDGGQGRSW